jgi:hypothetical protein
MKLTRKAGKIEALKEATRLLPTLAGKVGWFPSAVYEGGQPVAGVAMVQEFGSPSRGIPPRPFMRSTSIEKRDYWASVSRNLAKGVALGQITPADLMTGVTEAAAGDIRQTISKLTSPPLKEQTVKARKRKLANGGVGATAGISKPLIASGIMLNTLTAEVGEK